MSEYTKQAEKFLANAKATISIEFVGRAVNKNWREDKLRNLYRVTLTSPRGSMAFDFWDSIHNTELSRMTPEQYAAKHYRAYYAGLDMAARGRILRELKQKKAEAMPAAYSVLACMSKDDPGAFKDFCWEFGYNDDSPDVMRLYFAVQEEYTNLSRLFTPAQMDELREIW